MVNVNAYNIRLDGNKRLSQNFLLSEFRCKDGSDVILVSAKLVLLLQKIRDWAASPVTINSAYRTFSYNKQIGGATSSQHCLGTAADIVVKGKTPSQVAAFVETLMPDRGGIGIYGSFVHVDVRAAKSRWDG